MIILVSNNPAVKISDIHLMKPPSLAAAFINVRTFVFSSIIQHINSFNRSADVCLELSRDYQLSFPGKCVILFNSTPLQFTAWKSFLEDKKEQKLISPPVSELFDDHTDHLLLRAMPGVRFLFS